MRHDFQHKLSTKLVNENQVIGIETLNLKGMARTRLAKSIMDAGIGETIRQLTYKADWYGRILHKANPFYPSTQLCCTCGNKQAMPLSERVYHCQQCGMVRDRDWNAAINLEMVAVGHTDTLNAW